MELEHPEDTSQAQVKSMTPLESEEIQKTTTPATSADPATSTLSEHEFYQRRGWEYAWKRLTERIGPRYRHATLKGFELFGTEGERALQQQAIDVVRDYGLNMKDRIDQGVDIVFYGPPGTGKDHFLVSLLRHAVLNGATAEWVNGMSLYRMYRDSMDSGQSERDIEQQHTSPKILAISDPLPPRGAISDFQAGCLFSILDERYRQCKPTWITLNVASGEEAGARMCEQLIDRLRENSLSVHCNWPSWRSRERD